MLGDVLRGASGEAVQLALVVASLPVVLMTGYLARLALAARHPPATSGETHAVRLDVIVPAHNEAAGLLATLESLAASDYPPDAFRVVVVADNCTDETATIAREAGVIVLERQHADERGKGYALRHAFRWSRQEGWAQAVVVIDADTTVAASTLRELAARLAAGEGAVQADYRVRNSDASWRTRLLELAFTLHHTVRSLGRERLGWSCGLRGNGMALSHATLERAPYEAFSIVEDLEYGIVLGLAGIRVSYAARAEVRGDMPTGGGADARGQRARWEVGRRTLRHRFTPILWRSWHDGRLTHRKLCGDLLADLLTLPLVTVTVLTVLGGLAATAAWLVGAPSWGLTPWAISLGALLVYLVQGVRLSASPAAALRALLAAPIFIGWKLVGRGGATEAQRGEWVRTARAAQP